MTVAAFTQTPPYVVTGVGPYEISHPYTAGSIVPRVLVDGVPVDLDASQITIDPAESANPGNLYLSATIAAEHAGRTLWIDRDTGPVQGWEARYGDREVGMEGQLDRDTMSLQDLRQQLAGALRGRTATSPFEPMSDHVPVFTEAGWVNGPQIGQIYGAEAAATEAKEAAAAAAAAAATIAGGARSTFVALVASGALGALGAGSTVMVQGLSYMRQPGATTISDLPGWMPSGVVEPGHFPLDAAYLAYIADGNRNVAFRASGATVMRPAVQRLRDSVSALDLMSSGGLDEAVRHREATAADASEITGHAQEAIETCAQRAWRMDVPAGLYHLSEQLQASRPLSIIGSGDTQAVLRWSSGAASEGIKISAGGVVRASHVEKLRLEIDKPTSGTAVEVDYSSLQGESGTVFPRAELHFRMRDVTARGRNIYTAQGWNRGFVGRDLLGADIEACRMIGRTFATSDTVPYSDCAYWFGGEGKPTQFNLRASYATGFKTGVQTEKAEGVYICDGTELVNVGVGVRVLNTEIEPAFHLSNSHIAAIQKCVELTYCVESAVSHCVLYPMPGVAGDFIGIDVREGCYSMLLDGNNFNRSNITAIMRCIMLTGGDYTQIDGNRFSPGSSSGCTGIYISGEASNTMIGSMNTFRNANTRITNFATSTFARDWPGAYTASLDAIPLSAAMRVQRHVLGVGAADGPSGVATTGALVETTAYDANTAVQTMVAPGDIQGRSYIRRMAGGIWGAWYRFTGEVA